MPQDLPKAVMILIWLLSGTIIVGALLMKVGVVSVLLFILLYFALPVAVYHYLKKQHANES